MSNVSYSPSYFVTRFTRTPEQIFVYFMFWQLYFVRKPLSQVQEILQSFVPTWQNLMQPSSMNCAQNIPAPTQRSDPEWVLSDSSPPLPPLLCSLVYAQRISPPTRSGSLDPGSRGESSELAKTQWRIRNFLQHGVWIGSSNKVIPSCCILPFES